MKKLLILLMVGLTATSCATIISGSRQTVVFSAPEGTRIYNDGVRIAEIPLGYSEVAVVMPRSLSGLYMIAKNNGYADTHFYLKSSVNAVVFVNILLGGIIGGAVDLATGAAAKFPNYLRIDMDPLPSSF